MGKYQNDRNKRVKASPKIHPVWAGIGFLMVIIVPIMTWAGATELVNLAQKQNPSLLYSFPRYLSIPSALYAIPGVGLIAGIENFPAIAILFFFMLIVISGLLSLVYAFVYRLVGPPRYAPDDIPAPRIRTKPFKR